MYSKLYVLKVHIKSIYTPMYSNFEKYYQQISDYITFRLSHIVCNLLMKFFVFSAEEFSTAKRHHSGHFRHATAEVWDPHPQYEFTAFGRRFRLRLAHDASFVSPDIKVRKIDQVAFLSVAKHLTMLPKSSYKIILSLLPQYLCKNRRDRLKRNKLRPRFWWAVSLLN